MCPEEARVQSNGSNPLANQSRVLSCRDWQVASATTAKQELGWFLIGGSEIIVDRLSRLFGHFEPYRLASLPLVHCCAIDRVTMRSNVLDPQAHDVASSELTIYSQVEHR